MAEVCVAGTIGYVKRIAFSKPSGRLPVHPNIQCIRSAQFSSIHPSLQPPTNLSIYPVCVYSCYILPQICPLFHLSRVPPLHVTIDIPLSRLIYPSLDLSVSPYPFFRLPIILLTNHIIPSNINQSPIILPIYDQIHFSRP
jgi:hypothetical protein